MACNGTHHLNFSYFNGSAGKPLRLCSGKMFTHLGLHVTLQYGVNVYFGGRGEYLSL